jgi:hypothetical protein
LNILQRIPFFVCYNNCPHLGAALRLYTYIAPPFSTAAQDFSVKPIVTLAEPEL